jgi:transposase-like protein
MQSIPYSPKLWYSDASFTRQSLKYVSWRDRKAFIADIKTVYQAATREEAEANLVRLEEAWGEKYGAAVRSWQNN